MNCSVCDGALKEEWKYCPDCGYDVRLGEPDELIDNDQDCFEPPVGVRATVFEVIVRQAMSGAPWRQMCAGPMKYNNITDSEVEAEVLRRKGSLPEEKSADRRSSPGWTTISDDENEQMAREKPRSGSGKRDAAPLTPIERLAAIKTLLLKLNKSATEETTEIKSGIDKALLELDRVMRAVQSQERLLDDVEQEAQLQRDLDRELRRTNNQFRHDDPGRHFFT